MDSGLSRIVGGTCGFGLGYIEQLESEGGYSPPSVALPCSSKHGSLSLLCRLFLQEPS